MTYWPVEVAHRAPINDFPPAWARSWGDDCYGLWVDLVVRGVTQRMRWIEPTLDVGFMMGSLPTERAQITDAAVRDWANKTENTPIRMQVSNGFWLADTPCTQGFWFAVTGENPSHFADTSDAENRPVEQVEFHAERKKWDVKRFLESLNSIVSQVNACLPSEVEWEYASRAGTSTAYWWGDVFDPKFAHSFVDADPERTITHGTKPVGSYPPNPWGLYDMNGNIGEYCEGPWMLRHGHINGYFDTTHLPVRGGSWHDSPGALRSACRSAWPSEYSFSFFGFRFAIRSLLPISPATSPPPASPLSTP
jgi:sulfatase modifying factor 1